MVLGSLGPNVTMVPDGTCRPLELYWPPWQCGPWTPTWSYVAAHISGMCMDFNDLKIYSHQHRLWQDQGSRPLTKALALTILWSQLTALATQIGLAQVVTQPLDSNMVTGCSTGLQVSTWPLAETWASTQTLAMAEPWTQT